MTEYGSQLLESRDADSFRDDLLSRGYSRRHLVRIAALLGAGVVLAQHARPAFAQQTAKAVVGQDRIWSNECWTVPFATGARAALPIISLVNVDVTHNCLTK